MKKYLPTILACLCLLISAVLAIAKGSKVSKAVAVHTHMKMEILADGQPTEDRMLVGLDIFDHAGKIHVIWNHVYIRPFHETKTVVLKAQHFSTQEGSIKNVMANNDSFSFTLDFSGELLGAGRTAQVVGSKQESGIGYDMEASGLWWSPILNKKLKTEWRTTDKKFVLPYKEVF